MPGMNDPSSTAIDLLQETREEQADLIRRMFDGKPDDGPREALERRTADLARQKEEFEERLRSERKKVAALR